jgi:hypothetical protein
MVDIQKLVLETLVDENEERSVAHVSSGKLSASILSWPIQWQILKWIGVKQKPFTPQKLAEFRRGVILEDELCRLLKSCGKDVTDQVPVEYRNTVGFLDILMNDHPIEVKSTDPKYFKKLKGAKRGHILQACLYALALEKDDFSVVYIQPSTLAIKQYDYKTAEWKKHVDLSITKFEKAQESYEKHKRVPGLQYRERWQSFPGQNVFPKYEGFTSSFKLTKIK